LSKHHNWHQLKVVLEQLGFTQIRDYSNQILYFGHSDGRIIAFEKSNNMSQPYLLTILRRIGIDYDTFVKLYTPKDT